MPSLFEFLGFVWQISGVIMGPYIEYADFKNWIDLTGNYKKMPAGSKGPASIIPALTKLLIGFASMATFIIFTEFLGFSIQFCGTKEYLTCGSLPYKILYFYMAMTGQRFFYYAPWSFSDAGVIACGIGYNQLHSSTPLEKENNYLWDRVYSIKIWELETAATSVVMMRHWNHQVSVWLNHYVAARLTTKGVKPGLKETV